MSNFDRIEGCGWLVRSEELFGEVNISENSSETAMLTPPVNTVRPHFQGILSLFELDYHKKS